MPQRSCLHLPATEGCRVGTRGSPTLGSGTPCSGNGAQGPTSRRRWQYVGAAMTMGATLLSGSDLAAVRPNPLPPMPTTRRSMCAKEESYILLACVPTDSARARHADWHAATIHDTMVAHTKKRQEEIHALGRRPVRRRWVSGKHHHDDIRDQACNNVR